MYLIRIFWVDSEQKPKLETYASYEKAEQIKNEYMRLSSVSFVDVYVCFGVEE